MKNTLTSLLAASSLLLSGCVSKKYLYDGKIGDDDVKLSEKRYIGGKLKLLTILKPDGSTLNMGKCEAKHPYLGFVRIYKNGQTNIYTINDREFMIEAAKTFNEYMERINESNAITSEVKRPQDFENYSARQKQGIEDLK